MIKPVVIQELMALKKLSKVQLSKMIGLSETAVYNLLSTGNCRFSTAKKLADVLNVSLNELLEDQYLPMVTEPIPTYASKPKLFIEQRIEILEDEVRKLKVLVEAISNSEK